MYGYTILSSNYLRHSKQNKRTKVQTMPENEKQVQSELNKCDGKEEKNTEVLLKRVEQLEIYWNKISKVIPEDGENKIVVNEEKFRNLSNFLEECKTELENIKHFNREEIESRIKNLEATICDAKLEKDHPLMRLIQKLNMEEISKQFVSIGQFKDVIENEKFNNNSSNVPEHKPNCDELLNENNLSAKEIKSNMPLESSEKETTDRCSHQRTNDDHYMCTDANTDFNYGEYKKEDRAAINDDSGICNEKNAIISKPLSCKLDEHTGVEYRCVSKEVGTEERTQYDITESTDKDLQSMITQKEILNDNDKIESSSSDLEMCHYQPDNCSENVTTSHNSIFKKEDLNETEHNDSENNFKEIEDDEQSISHDIIDTQFTSDKLNSTEQEEEEEEKTLLHDKQKNDNDVKLPDKGTNHPATENENTIKITEHNPCHDNRSDSLRSRTMEAIHKEGFQVIHTPEKSTDDTQFPKSFQIEPFKSHLKEEQNEHNGALINGKTLIEYLEAKMSKLEATLEATTEKIRNSLTKEEDNKLRDFENRIQQLEQNDKCTIITSPCLENHQKHQQKKDVQESETKTEKNSSKLVEVNKTIYELESRVARLENKKEETEATESIKRVDGNEYLSALHDLQCRVDNFEDFVFTERKGDTARGATAHVEDLQDFDIRLARLEESSESEKTHRVGTRVARLEHDHHLMKKHLHDIEQTERYLLMHEHPGSWPKNDFNWQSPNYASSTPIQNKAYVNARTATFPTLAEMNQETRRMDEKLQEQTVHVHRMVESISHRLESLESLMKLRNAFSEPPCHENPEATAPRSMSFRSAATASASTNGTPEILGKALFRAAEEGRFKDVRDLLTGGVAVEAASRGRCTALHAAAVRGHVEVVEKLLASGACATARNVAGLTPLHLAAQEGHVACVRALLRAGAPWDVVSRNGLTPLQLALKWGGREAAEVLRLAENGL